MSDLFVMRRANGDLFTEQVGGRPVVPAWKGLEALARYKERNPELLIFLPKRLDQPVVDRLTKSETPTELLLFSGDDPDADLEDGVAISLEDALSMNDHRTEAARAE